MVECEISPTDPTSNVELWCTDIVPNWSLRQSVDEWGLANGYGVLDPPEEATRVTKDGTHVQASANDVRRALTHQYLQALHRAHPRQAAILVFLMTFTLGTITVTTLTVARSIYSVVGELFRDANRVVRRGSRAERRLVGRRGRFSLARESARAIRRSARSGASARNSRARLISSLGARR